MLLPDVNVLLYAFRREFDQHTRYRRWLQTLISGDDRFAMSELVLSSVVRIATTRQIFQVPETTETALAFADSLKSHPQCVLIAPGARHWNIFARLCRDARISGKLVSDAYLAALAIEHGCEWITADRDFSRFPGLRWRHPLG